MRWESFVVNSTDTKNFLCDDCKERETERMNECKRLIKIKEIKWREIETVGEINNKIETKRGRK